MDRFSMYRDKRIPCGIETTTGRKGVPGGNVRTSGCPAPETRGCGTPRDRSRNIGEPLVSGIREFIFKNPDESRA